MEPVDCAFCRNLTDGSFDVVGAGTTAVVVLDRQPINRGHVLVIPVRHAPDLASLTDQEATEMMVLAQRADRAVRAVFDPAATGTNLLMSNGPSADQDVPHAHLHVIPRQEGDGYEFREDLGRYPLPPLTQGERDDLRSRIGGGRARPPRSVGPAA
jgi:diadenosine tetraphosphate (Ap4A) HIT family hydrolase